MDADAAALDAASTASASFGAGPAALDGSWTKLDAGGGGEMGEVEASSIALAKRLLFLSNRYGKQRSRQVSKDTEVKRSTLTMKRSINRL